MDLIETLNDYGGLVQVVTIGSITILLWIGSIWYQNRDAKKRLKQELFLKLMANRKTEPVTIEWADALNQIDVVFQGSEKVRKAWRNYYESLHEGDSKSQNNHTYKIEMLSMIAMDLGYKNLHQSDIAAFYTPLQLLDDKLHIYTVGQNLLRIMRNSVSFSESVPKKTRKKEAKRRMKNRT